MDMKRFEILLRKLLAGKEDAAAVLRTMLDQAGLTLGDCLVSHPIGRENQGTQSPIMSKAAPCIWSAYEKKLSDLKRSKISDEWESGFISSLIIQRSKGRALTPKQIGILDRIHRKLG